jgi:pyrroloquinoline quinone (PQQ) biosynthesis protein C
MEDHDWHRGRFAYEAYRRMALKHGLRFAELLPEEFEELSLKAQAAWVETADVVCDKFGATL